MSAIQDFTSVFLLKQSVCAGYSRTFQYLCKKAGIKCTYVPGDTDEPHAWNLVELNGKYYWVDVTWGDPIYDDGTQTLNYHYFMTTDEVLFRTHYTLDGKVLLNSYDSIDVFNSHNVQITHYLTMSRRDHISQHTIITESEVMSYRS